MRKFIDITQKLLEGDVVDFAKHKQDKTAEQKPQPDFADAVNDVVGGEKAFFATGKFMPLGYTFIKSGFEANYQPNIELEVRFRDARPKPEARALMQQLSTQRFKYLPAMPFAKGTRPKVNAEQDAWGPRFITPIDLNTAKDLFANREHSPYGVYQPSELGFRASHQRLWDARGVGFNIMVSGYDYRRGDKHGDNTRHETHVIDTEQDMTEVVNMFAAIRRGQIKSVS